MATGFLIQELPGSHCTYVNGLPVYGYWVRWSGEEGTGKGSPIPAYGEALDEAIALACLAFPGRLANFHCGNYL